jgi:hypothetical protein
MKCAIDWQDSNVTTYSFEDNSTEILNCQNR